jgi:hypothetical protein
MVPLSWSHVLSSKMAIEDPEKLLTAFDIFFLERTVKTKDATWALNTTVYLHRTFKLAVQSEADDTSVRATNAVSVLEKMSGESPKAKSIMVLVITEANDVAILGVDDESRDTIVYRFKAAAEFSLSSALSQLVVDIDCYQKYGTVNNAQLLLEMCRFIWEPMVNLTGWIVILMMSFSQMCVIGVARLPFVGRPEDSSSHTLRYILDRVPTMYPVVSVLLFSVSACVCSAVVAIIFSILIFVWQIFGRRLVGRNELERSAKFSKLPELEMNELEMDLVNHRGRKMMAVVLDRLSPGKVNPGKPYLAKSVRSQTTTRIITTQKTLSDLNTTTPKRRNRVIL